MPSTLGEGNSNKRVRMLWMQRFVTKKPLKGFNTMRLGLVQGRDISSFSSGELSSSIWSCSYKPGQGSCNFCCFTITTSSGWCHSASRQHPMAVLSLVILVQKQGNESMRNSLSSPAGILLFPQKHGEEEDVLEAFGASPPMVICPPQLRLAFAPQRAELCEQARTKQKVALWH